MREETAIEGRFVILPRLATMPPMGEPHTPAGTAATRSEPSADDTFTLYDLKVEVVAPDGARIYCGAQPGDFFELRGEMLHLPDGQGFSIYSLAAVLPLLAAKQRHTDAADWMTSDAEVACPDPNCLTRLRITRTGTRTFAHSETTAVPLPPRKPR